MHMVNSKKMAIVLLGLLVMTTAQAVQVTNNISEAITLYDFTFISGIEIGKYPVTLQPGEIFAQNDIASFSLKISDKIIDIDPLENLNDATQLFLNPVNEPWSWALYEMVMKGLIIGDNNTYVRFYGSNW